MYIPTTKKQVIRDSDFLTLEAKRFKTKHGFKTELYFDGELKATIPDTQKQPHGNKKYITLNCFTWKLKFIKS